MVSKQTEKTKKSKFSFCFAKLRDMFLSSFIDNNRRHLEENTSGVEHFFSQYSKLIIKLLLSVFVILIFFHINRWLELLFELINFDVNKASAIIIVNRFIDVTLVVGVLLFIPLYLFYRMKDSRLWSNSKSVFILFSIYPFLPRSWDYINSAWCPWFNYVKCFFLTILVVEAIHFIYTCWSNSKNEKLSQSLAKGFITDNPILHSVEDSDDSIINRKRYIQDVADMMVATDLSEAAFAVGVAGTWGSGKSTLLSSLKSTLPSSSIIIDFNPWFSSSKEQIIFDFFQTLSNSLSIYNPALAKQFTKYAKSLSEIIPSTFVKQTVNLLIDMNSSDDLRKQYDSISREIVKINKRVYVFIDDLDRLEKDEILEVLKLIRNTANFKNMLFVVGYDREYIIQSIKTKGVFNAEQFIEKIFSVEITIPSYEKEILIKSLKNKLSISLDFSNEKFYNFLYHTESTSNDYFITRFLQNMRDVKRFSNIFTLSLNSFYPNNSDDINILELFIVELLRYRFYSFYLYLQTNPTALLHYDEKIGRYYLLIDNSEFKSRFRNKENFREEFVKRITELGHLKFEPYDLITIYESLWLLFSHLESKDKKNSIVFPHNMPRYFAFRIMDYNLSAIEFDNAYESSEKFNHFIDKWIKEGKSEAFIFNLESIPMHTLFLTDKYIVLFSGYIYFGSKYFPVITDNNLWQRYLLSSRNFFNLSYSNPAFSVNKANLKNYIESVEDSNSYVILIHMLSQIYDVDLEILENNFEPKRLLNNDEVSNYVNNLFGLYISSCPDTKSLFSRDDKYHVTLNACIVGNKHYEEHVKFNLASKSLYSFIDKQSDGANVLMSFFGSKDTSTIIDEESYAHFVSKVKSYFNTVDNFKNLLISFNIEENHDIPAFLKKHKLE